MLFIVLRGVPRKTEHHSHTTLQSEPSQEIFRKAFGQLITIVGHRANHYSRCLRDKTWKLRKIGNTQRNRRFFKGDGNFSNSNRPEIRFFILCPPLPAVTSRYLFLSCAKFGLLFPETSSGHPHWWGNTGRGVPGEQRICIAGVAPSSDNDERLLTVWLGRRKGTQESRGNPG